MSVIEDRCVNHNTGVQKIHMGTLPACPQAGLSKQNEPFFDLGQKVREEILRVLKELKLTTPPPPPEPKIVSKEELKEALMALLA